MKTVEDLMIKNVITIAPHATLKEGLLLMKKHNIKAVVVEKGRKGDAYGILQYRDVARVIIANEGDIELLNIYDIATKPVIQVSKELEAKYVIKLMLDHSMKRVLVIDNNELEGFISMSDVIADVINKAVEEN